MNRARFGELCYWVGLNWVELVAQTVSHLHSGQGVVLLSSARHQFSVLHMGGSRVGEGRQVPTMPMLLLYHHQIRTHEAMG